MNLVLILGEPGSGKSEVVQRVIKHLGTGSFTARAKAPKLNEATAVCYPFTNTAVLGVYDSRLFCGTDRLGRNCCPSMIELFKKLDGGVVPAARMHIVGEGDRITTQSMIERIQTQTKYHLVPILLDVPTAVCRERRAQREAAGGQEWLNNVASATVAGKPRRSDRLETGLSETWLKGRQTKLKNVLALLPKYYKLKNETEADLEFAVKFVLTALRLELKGAA